MNAMQSVASSTSVSALNQRKVKQPSSDSLEMPARRHRSGLAGLTACLGRAFTCFVPKREARTLRLATPVLRDPLHQRLSEFAGETVSDAQGASAGGHSGFQGH